MNENFDLIRNDGRLLYEYIRGSHLYGLNTKDSDVDTSGVFVSTADELLGVSGYKAQVSDAKHDNTWFEIGELVKLLLKSNPTVMESLFIPKDKIIGEVHPLMQILLDNRDVFISKECFNPFFGYAKSQIAKARGLNKMITQPILERKTPFDFIYTFKNQGSTKVKDWLENRHLKQKYCGLVNIPNMHDVYGLYYDWGAHTHNEEGWEKDEKFIEFYQEVFNMEWYMEAVQRLKCYKPIGYHGIVLEDGDSNELRLSSIEDKNIKPLIHISYNKDGYKAHCTKYKEQKIWEKERNPKRYESNLDKTYDSKNMMHCFRLIHMAKEIARGEGINLVRTKDKEFLLAVRNHEFEYEEIMKMLEEETLEMNELMKTSTIQEHIDRGFVNELMIKIRKEQLNLT